MTTLFLTGVMSGFNIVDERGGARVPAGQEMALHLYFGVNRDLSQEAHALVLLLEKPVQIAGYVRDRLGVEKIPLEASYEFWKSLRTRGEEAYRTAKEELAVWCCSYWRRASQSTRPRDLGSKGGVDVSDRRAVGNLA